MQKQFQKKQSSKYNYQTIANQFMNIYKEVMTFEVLHLNKHFKSINKPNIIFAAYEGDQEFLHYCAY